MITCDISMKKAQELFDAYWEMNWSIKESVKYLEVRKVQDQKYLKNPVSGYWYTLRKENDKFSTLVQGTAAYAFDVWVRHVLEKREQLTAQFHDEIVLCVLKGYRDQCTEILRTTIKETNEILKLNRELDIGIHFGDRYSDIH